MRVPPKALRIILTALIALTFLLTTSVMVLASVWPTINKVETGRTLAYPELQPKIYQLDYDRVYAETLDAIRSQEGWSLLNESREKGRIQSETFMPVTGWRYVVTVDVIKRSEYVSRIHITSEGQDAPGDLGHNARLIQSALDALDARLGAADVSGKERIVQE